MSLIPPIIGRSFLFWKPTCSQQMISIFFRQMYAGSFLVMVNQFGTTAACFMGRGFQQGATLSPWVFYLFFDLVDTIARAGGRGWMLQGSSTLSSSSGPADDTAIHTKGQDAIPAKTIMVQEVGA